MPRSRASIAIISFSRTPRHRSGSASLMRMASAPRRIHSTARREAEGFHDGVMNTFVAVTARSASSSPRSTTSARTDSHSRRDGSRPARRLTAATRWCPARSW